MSKHSRTVSIFLGLVTLVSVQSPSLSAIKNFLVDPTKPYVYLEVDHIGPRERERHEEPNTGIYLRLRNNCRLPIIVSTFGAPKNGAVDEIGVMDEVILDPPVVGVFLGNPESIPTTVPLLLNLPDELLSPEEIKAKEKLRAEWDAKAKAEIERERAREEAEAKELADRPNGYFSDVGSTTLIAPGNAIYFSFPINHVDKRWHIEIPFRFAIKRQGPIRQPYNYVAFFWDDLPATYRNGSAESVAPKPSSSK